MSNLPTITEKAANIVENPKAYFGEKRSSLDDRIKAVELSPADEAEISSKRLRKTIRDKTLGLFKVGQVINEFISWNENVEKDIKDAKRNALMAGYFDLCDDNSHAIENLKNFVTDPQGNTLFNKLLKMLDDSPPDIERMQHLAAAMKHIADSDFIRLFDAHKYALGLIDQVSPQSLTILSDYKSWPVLELGSYNASGSKITSDYLSEFSKKYSEVKNISDTGMIGRVQHAANDLISRRLIEAHLIEGGGTKCFITEVGQVILPYISYHER